MTGERFQILQCRRCGFAMTDPVPLSMDPYYPARYRRFNALAAFVLRRLYLRRVDGWHARLPNSGVALELGSGTGWMLRALRERGWLALGSERTVAAAATARSLSSRSIRSPAPAAGSGGSPASASGRNGARRRRLSARLKTIR